MGLVRVWSAFSFIVATFFVGQLYASQISEDYYDFYLADYNSDELMDVVGIPKKRILILSSPVTFPIDFSEKAIVLLQQNDGIHEAIYPADQDLIAALNLWPLSYELYAGDFDGDGLEDLLFQSEDNGAQTFIAYSDKRGNNIRALSYLGTDGMAASASDVTIRDIQGDGFDDVIFEMNDGSVILAYGGSNPIDPVDFVVDNKAPGGNIAPFLSGAFQVGEMGDGTYSIDIETPPSISGIQPSFSVNYSSSGGNGYMGVGWQLAGESSLARCGTTILEDGYIDPADFDGNDQFCLDGIRLTLVSGIHGRVGSEYRLQNDNVQRVVVATEDNFGPESWVVYSPKGAKSFYGSTENSRIYRNGGGVFSWSLDLNEDVYGNSISYEYNQDKSSNEHYITKALYETYSVEFEYAPRQDVMNGYMAPLVPYSVSQLLDRVIVSNNDQKLLNYKFTYSTPGDDRGVLLPYLERINVCLENGACKRSPGWKYAEQESASLSGRMPWSDLWRVDDSNGSGGASVIQADWNADGLPDFLWQKKSTGSNHFFFSNLSGGYSGVANRFAPHGVDDGRFKNGDFNGDGIPDTMFYDSGSGHNRWFINRRNSPGEFIYHSDPIPTGQADGGGYIVFGDWNGDGATDPMIYYKGSGFNKFYISNGVVNGDLDFSNPVNNVLPNGSIDEYSGSKGYITVGDWNNDGLDDLAFFNTKEGHNRWFINETVWQGGSGQIKFRSVIDPIDPEHVDNDGSFFIGDWNGDGIQDLGWHHPEKGDNRWFINDGTAHFSVYKFNPISSGSIDGGNGHLMTGDWNGDGIEDAVWHHTDGRNRWFLNDGNLTFRQMNDINVSTSLVDSENTMIIPGDFDASGTTDVLYYNKKTGNNSIHLFQGKQKVNIIEFYDPLGSTMELVYEKLIFSESYAEELLPEEGNTLAPPPMSVVVRAITDDGLGGVQTNEFEYWDYTANIRGYGSLGFRKQVSIDALTGIQTITEYSQDYENHTVGMVDKTATKQIKDGYEKTLNETVNINDVQLIQYDNHFVRMPYLKNQSVTSWDYVTEEMLGTVVTDYVYRTDGDLDSTISITSDSLGNVVSTTEKTMTYEPVRYAPHYLAGLVSTIESTNTVAGGGWANLSPEQLSVTRKTAFTYYDHGAPLTQVIEPNNAKALTTTFEYNSKGQTKKTTTSAPGMVSRAAITRYYTNGREYQQENALGHVTTYLYENTSYPWLATKVVDPNGLVAETVYDEWGRTLTSIAPDGNSITQQMKWCDVNCKEEYSEVYYSETSPSIGMQSWTFFDKQGREVRKTAYGFSDGDPRLIHQITEYNSIGKIARHSDPFFEGGTPQWSQTWYDDLGRMVVAYDPAGNSMTTNYAGRETVSSRSNTDGVAQAKTVERNAAGQLVKATDSIGGTVEYAYDAQGNLVSTKGPQGEIIKAGFDVFGNKMFTDDPNKGRWEYEYDGFGQLVSQTDARDVQTTMEYDVLGRMTQRYDDFDGDNQELTTWEYDTAALGNTGRSALGMLRRVQKPSYVQAYEYDDLGRSSGTTTEMDSAPNTAKFQSSISYNNLTQQPDTMTYPQEMINNVAQPSLVLKNHYHSELGILTKVTNNTTGEPYWELEETNAKGQAILFQLGNVIHTSRSFNQQTGYIDTINTYVDSQVESIQDMAFYFDGVGNLRRRHDYIANVDQYVDEYDQLNRINSVRTVTSLNTYTQNLTYDANGNILTKSDVGSYTYGSTTSYQALCKNNFAGPQAVTYIENGGTSKSYCYDANGNMVGGDGRTVTYGNIDKPVTIEKGDNQVDFYYGPGRSRYKRIDDEDGSITTTYYLGSYEKVIKGAAVTHKYYIGNYAVVTKEDSDPVTHFLLTDHQGSIVAKVDTGGNVLDRFAYDPWGRRLATGWQPQSDSLLAQFKDPIISRGYTGHEHIDSMGLIHMNGRVYDPTIGRFLSSDPFVQDATNTQALNRYAYVQNNPLSYTDPSGYFLKKIKKAIKKVARAVTKAVKAIVKMHGEVFLAWTVGGRPGLKFIAKQLGRNKYGAQAAQLVGCTVAAYACPVIVGIITTAMAYGATGDLSAALVSGLGAAAVSWAMPGVNVTGGVSKVTAMVVERSIGHIAGSAMNGAVSAVNGGSFKDGFNASFKINSAGDYLKNMAINYIAATVVKGVLGPKETSSTSSGCGTDKPIDIQTGRKFLIINDLKTGRLTFVRHYNSFANRPSDMGGKWRHEFEKNLEIDQHNGIVIAVRGDGQTVQFNVNDGKARAIGNKQERLQQQGEDWLLTNSDDSVERYNGQGRLQAITYRDGYTQTLHYEQGSLQKVADSEGRHIQLRYDYAGLLVEITNTGGHAVGFRYNTAHALVRVTQPDGNDNPLDNPKVEYRYEDARFPHALTGLIDENGKRFGTWEYDAQMRAYYEHQEGQGTNTLDYQDGNITTLTDALRRATTYHFNDDGKPTLVEGHPTASCIGSNNQYEYDDAGNLTAKTDWNENRIEYEFNDRGLEISRTEASGTPEAYTVRTEWHDTYRLPVKIVRPGNTTTLEYDDQGQLLRKTITDTTIWWGDERTWAYQYNDQRQLVAIDGPQSGEQDTTRFEYDTLGNQIAVISALNHRTQVLEHNADGLPTLLQDQNGTQTRLDYNARGWLTEKAIQLEGGNWAKTRYDYTDIGAYDGTGLVETVTQPNGASLTYEYNAARQVTAISNNLGERIEYQLDAMGNRVKEDIIGASGELKRTQAHVYDELSRLLQSIGADGYATEYGYDRNGNVTSITDALQHSTSKAYDGLNRLVSSVDALGGETTTEYSPVGTVAKVVDARGVVTRYQYNGFGEVIALISQDTGTTTYEHDDAGNQILKEDANGVVTEYRYDALNRLTDVLYPQAGVENIRYQYDVATVNAIGRVAKIEDQTGTTQRAYDGRGNIIQETRLINGQAYQMAYDYDTAGNLTSMTYPNGAVIRYHRDGMGRVEKVTRATWMGETVLATDIQYLPFGPIESLRYGNGLVEEKQYDLDYRLQAHRIAGVYEKQYQYEPTGNISDILDRINAANDKHYQYDELSRLTMAATGTGQAEVFDYDAVGNRTLYQRTANGDVLSAASYTYADTSNRLLSVVEADSQRTLGYDPAGNTIRDDRSDQQRTLEYGVNNRLQRVSKDGVAAAHYRHNAQGQRVIRMVEGKETHFIYDTQDRLIAEANSDGAIQRQYVYLGRTMIAMEEAANDQWYFVHNDHLGTPKVVSDRVGRIQWSGEASAFGVTAQSGGMEFGFRFPGQTEDGVTGYFYNYYRDYDPSLGRYLQSDPIGLNGGMNVFVYSYNSPVSLFDSNGLRPEDFYAASNVLDVILPRYGYSSPKWSSCFNCDRVQPMAVGSYDSNTQRATINEMDVSRNNWGVSLWDSDLTDAQALDLFEAHVHEAFHHNQDALAGFLIDNFSNFDSDGIGDTIHKDLYKRARAFAEEHFEEYNAARKGLYCPK